MTCNVCVVVTVTLFLGLVCVVVTVTLCLGRLRGGYRYTLTGSFAWWFPSHFAWVVCLVETVTLPGSFAWWLLLHFAWVVCVVVTVTLCLGRLRGGYRYTLPGSFALWVPLH